jgi:intracellular septation protein A
MTVTSADDPGSPSAAERLPRFKEVWPSLRRALLRFGGAGVLPIICFYIGYRTDGPILGIMAGMAASLVALSVQAWRLRRLDPVAVLPMAVILVQGTIALLAGSAEIYLAAPAVEAVIWGLVLIGSVIARRPLVPLIARELGVVPRSLAESVGLRRALAILTIAWGIAAFAKAGIRIWLLMVLPIEVFLIAITATTATINLSMLAVSVWLPFRMVRQAAPSGQG